MKVKLVLKLVFKLYFLDVQYNSNEHFIVNEWHFMIIISMSLISDRHRFLKDYPHLLELLVTSSNGAMAQHKIRSQRACQGVKTLRLYAESCSFQWV